MAELATFLPEELDRIEDALVDLEGRAELVDPAPHVRQRMLEYQHVLRMSREALPMQAVPSALVEQVLAAARTTGPAEVVELGTAAGEPPRDGVWTRVRRMLLVPALAVAATAALVLLVATPMLERAAPDPAVARVEPEAPAVADEFRPANGAPAPAPALAAEAPADAPAESEPVLREVATSHSSAAKRDDQAKAKQEPPAANEADVAAGDVSGAKPGAGAKTPVPSQQAGGSPRWDIIARGDRARRDGDCGSARLEYKRALDDDDVGVQARAWAGLGLCDAAASQSSAAQSEFGRAKELDPSIAEFIATERGDVAPKKSSKRRKSNQAPIAAEDMFDEE